MALPSLTLDLIMSLEGTQKKPLHPVQVLERAHRLTEDGR